jgi:3-oxoacyl-[acyl-carrier-protein] synthase II
MGPGRVLGGTVMMHHQRQRPRIAITGVGVATPAGADIPTFWSTICSGRSSATTLDSATFGPSGVTIGCPVRELDLSLILPAKQQRRLSRVTQLGLFAAVAARDDAQLTSSSPARSMVVCGTGIGGLETWEEQIGVYWNRGVGRMSPFTVPMVMPNATAAAIAMHLRWTGPSVTTAMACAAGAQAIVEGARAIAAGDSDVVLAGGSEALLTPVVAAAFSRTGAMTSATEPGYASRPFDKGRDGFVMGEGAAFLVLEDWDHAQRRGATIRGELLGWAATSDAHHITSPQPDGLEAMRCMELALARAGLGASDIAHVNAHGTSTKMNDKIEASSIAAVFPASPAVTATKGCTGHLLGASGAVEAVATLLSAETGIVPPTANFEEPDEDTQVLSVVAGEPKDVGGGPAVSNSFAFGGHNVSLVIGPAK